MEPRGDVVGPAVSHVGRLAAFHVSHGDEVASTDPFSANAESAEFPRIEPHELLAGPRGVGPVGGVEVRRQVVPVPIPLCRLRRGEGRRLAAEAPALPSAVVAEVVVERSDVALVLAEGVREVGVAPPVARGALGVRVLALGVARARAIELPLPGQVSLKQSL